MSRWMINANDIENPDQVDETLLHRTNPINRFLDPDSHDQYFLVATKGYGKTLLLKSKRALFRRPGMVWLPENDLVDRPIGDPRIFSKKDVKRIVEDKPYWVNIWLMSFTIAVIKSVQSTSLKLNCEALKDIFTDELIVNVTDTFTRLLDLGRDEYFSALKDLKRRLIPAYRQIHQPVAAFLDNIDEHFDKHLDNEWYHTTSVGVLDESFWYNAQIGLAEAVYQLRGANSHVKIFCSIRLEAFNKLLIGSPQSQQLRGASVTLSYSDEDLMEIFRKNVSHEHKSNLVEPDASDPIRAFLGAGLMAVPHQQTGQVEPIAQYLLRHTLRRPRDIVQMGQAIADISPRRRTIDALRRVANDTGRAICASYLKEVTPHIGDFNREGLFSLLSANILPATVMANVAEAYKSLYGPETENVFAKLYDIGLLGYVDRPAGLNGKLQTFSAPGESLFERRSTPPESSHYLIHAVLDNLIRPHSERYRENFDRWNIVGPGRSWREPSDNVFFVKGDIVKSYLIENDQRISAVFLRRFREVFDDLTTSCVYAKVEDGDSFRIADVNPSRLYEIVTTLYTEMRLIFREIEFRLGGDYGYVQFDERDNFPLSGQCLRAVSRLVCIARPNKILVTDTFASGILQLGASPAVEVASGVLRGGNGVSIEECDEGFSIRKEGNDENPFHTKLFEISVN